MPVSQTQDQLQSVSSFVVKDLMRAENMGTFTSSLGDDWVDPLDPKLQALLTTLKKGPMQYYPYTAGKEITDVSYELYGTTSAWWIILYLNGYMHPDEISDGENLKVPTADSLNSVNQNNAQISIAGTTVTI